MFDISWIEFAFVAILAVVIIGPKDLPVVFKWISNTVSQFRKLSNTMKGHMHKLQQEVDLSDGKVTANDDWQSLLPKEISSLPDDFIPGSKPAEYHQQRHSQKQDAKRAFKQTQVTEGAREDAGKR
ncbi:Sec-independent protein translocase subunit TatA/TatB [Agaribacter marinus]|uniref:Sec-independent protein translocase protein TatB n=1 Tax=Agaribacter marinus TaxID=1431249 RepID=A0AA37SVX0_9ALTE|nr:twin-arginine translocase TatA/TatE family subunit [Agaribacter marinus]GLR69309.1 hypothetical protein GCM10007852_02170 [Agaribacter marinus]